MTTRKKGVGSGTAALPPTAHTVQPVYSGDDIALGITCQLQIGDRRVITIQTHTTRDTEVPVLNALFDKVWTALDRVNARYRLQELKLNKKMQENQLALVLDNNASMRQKWEAEYQTGKRRGDFQMTATQHNSHMQQMQMVERHKQAIADLETEIKDVERQIAG